MNNYYSFAMLFPLLIFSTACHNAILLAKKGNRHCMCICCVTEAFFNTGNYMPLKLSYDAKQEQSV